MNCKLCNREMFGFPGAPLPVPSDSRFCQECAVMAIEVLEDIICHGDRLVVPNWVCVPETEWDQAIARMPGAQGWLSRDNG